jgi:hypothetical protein
MNNMLIGVIIIIPVLGAFVILIVVVLHVELLGAKKSSTPEAFQLSLDPSRRWFRHVYSYFQFCANIIYIIYIYILYIMYVCAMVKTMTILWTTVIPGILCQKGMFQG